MINIINYSKVIMTLTIFIIYNLSKTINFSSTKQLTRINQQFIINYEN